MSRPVYSLVGWSDSGKTTILEKLVPALKKRGLTVAVVKHEGHEFEMDTPGKDTWRMTRAGADVTAIVSGTHAAVLENRPLTLEETVARIRNVDIVLTEGGKEGPFPKIGVVRGKGLPPVKGDYILVMSDEPVQTAVPVLRLEDIEGLADRLTKDMEEQAMIRKATLEDVAGIVRIYDEIHTEEEAGRTTTGWIRDIYPTGRTAEDAIRAGEMFVREAEGRIVAAARINQVQDPAYAQAIWQADAPPERVMVLHTLVVSPLAKGQGYGSSFVRFYEQYAREKGCPYLRMDTNVRNTAARALYKRLGYREGSVIPCTFNGLENIRLLCLEKTL